MDPAIEWLLHSSDPSIRYLTRRDLLGENGGPPPEILNGPRVQALLAEGYRCPPYKKWTGAHWRLVALAELAAPPGHPRVRELIEATLAWWLGPIHQSRIVSIDGRVRRCASQEGNALGACCVLGLAADPRMQRLAESLIAWQWPDGGWNCDRRPAACHSSFYESLIPIWGLWEYHKATGHQGARAAAERAAELFLRHRLCRSEHTGEVIDPEWLKLHYPLYYHYDILQALQILAPLGACRDPRAGEALDLIGQKRRPDGRWAPEGCYWHPPGQRASNDEVVDWGRRGPNEFITLNALRVLKCA